MIANKLWSIFGLRKIDLTENRLTSNPLKCQHWWALERFLLSVYAFCNQKQTENFCSSRCLEKQPSPAFCVKAGCHGCQLGGGLLASLGEHRPWDPGALAPQTPSPQSQRHEFWHRQHRPFTPGPFSASRFSHPIPSSKACWALTLKGCAPDSAENSASACLAGKFPQEIPDTSTFRCLGGRSGFPEKGPPNSHPEGRQSPGSCCREDWALVLRMQSLTYLSFYSQCLLGPLTYGCSAHVSQRPQRDFPVGAVDKNPPASAGDMGLIPGLGRLHVLQST